MLVAYDGRLAVSTDEGHTWTVARTADEQVPFGAHANIPGTGYVIATSPGHGIPSRDGGVTWTDLAVMPGG